jgi:serine phosphatase RsbU (regulator of sigma subunit)/S1-C subfamily serine protease
MESSLAPYFDRHPNHFRLLFSLTGAYLFVLAIISFYRIASRPTDENLFTNPISNLYVTEALGLPNARSADKLLPGDLINRIGDGRVTAQDGLESAVASATADDVLVTAIRPATGEKKEIRLPRRHLAGGTVRDIGPTAQVVAVTEGGASDRAGMKIGDLIVRINGQRFKNSLDADRILAEGQVGKALVYDVLRDNKEIALHVTIAAIGVPFSLLVSTISGVLFIAMGLFLGMVRPRYQAARLLGMSILAFGYFIMVLLARRGGYVDTGLDLIRDATLIIAVFLSIPLTTHASFNFPIERPELKSKKWILAVGYTLAVVGIVTTALFSNIGFVAGLGFLILYTAAISLVFRKRASAEYKRLNRVVKNSSLVAAAGGMIMMVYFSITNQQQNVGYLGPILLLIPLSHLYTIGRYRLMDLDLRIRRNVQYILVTVAWDVLIAVIAFQLLLWLQEATLPIPNIRVTATSVEILDSPLQQDRRIWLEKGILMFAAVAVVYVGWRGAKRGQQLIDRVFFRAHHDYRAAANELAEVMATKLNMVELARGMVEKISGLLQLKRAGVLFFRDERLCCCQESYGFDGTAWAEFCISSHAELTQALQGVQGEASIEALPAAIRNAFHAHGFLYLAPIRSKEKLVGALLVGEKRSEATYQQEDLEFLGVVAKQASVAIENAFLYERLTEQERMKHELAIARRIQLASLPQKTPLVEGLDIAGTSRPALEVGGDYFDYLNGEKDTITVVVGDVSGKGTSAALYMSKLQGIIRSLHAFRLTPKELLTRANQLLCQDMEKNSFVTTITGSFETAARRLVLARAGHLPLYRFSASRNQVEKIIPRGLGLGLEATDTFSAELEERILSYEPSDVFLFVSDGVVEAEGLGGNQFGEENLMTALRRHSTYDAITILNSIMNDVQEFTGDEEQHDDQTIVVVKARLR